MAIFTYFLHVLTFVLEIRIINKCAVFARIEWLTARMNYRMVGNVGQNSAIIMVIMAV